jgi:hypothetical protein
MADEAASAGPQIRIQWITDPTAVPSAVNQFILQSGPAVQNDARIESVFLTFGSIVPPIVPPGLTPDQMSEYAANNVAVAVPVGRFVFTMPRFRELYGQMALLIEAADKAEGDHVAN